MWAFKVEIPLWMKRDDPKLRASCFFRSSCCCVYSNYVWICCNHVIKLKTHKHIRSHCKVDSVPSKKNPIESTLWTLQNQNYISQPKIKNNYTSHLKPIILCLHLNAEYACPSQMKSEIGSSLCWVEADDHNHILLES